MHGIEIPFFLTSHHVLWCLSRLCVGFQGLLQLLLAAYARLGLTGQDQVRVDCTWHESSWW
jgi:hypothetical protein